MGKLSILFTLFTDFFREKGLKIRKIITITGLTIIILGMVFHLQGKSIMGPKSSFMYSNPEWTTYGIQIVFLGAAFLGVGLLWSFLKRGN